MHDFRLVKIDVARKALAEARSVRDVKEIRDKAAALQHYLQQRDGSGEAARHAGELKLRAERRLGVLLKGNVEHGGDRKSKSVDVTLKTIPDGISRNQSSTWQTVAEVPEEEFEEYLSKTKEEEETPTTTAVYRLAKQKEKDQKRADKHHRHHGDGTGEIPFFDVRAAEVGHLDFIPDDSVDCIITDPPYPVIACNGTVLHVLVSPLVSGSTLVSPSVVTVKQQDLFLGRARTKNERKTAPLIAATNERRSDHTTCKGTIVPLIVTYGEPRPGPAVYRRALFPLHARRRSLFPSPAIFAGFQHL